MVEARKGYAEDKEEEVKFLERSIEELEYVINVLENKVCELVLTFIVVTLLSCYWDSSLMSSV